MKRLALQFYGGLGDALWNMYYTRQYVCLEELEPGDKAHITIVTHNPHVNEMFLWHPKKDQLEVVDCGFITPWDDNERKKWKLPPLTDVGIRYPEPLNYYPSPNDALLLDQLRSGDRYVVFAVSAGTSERTLPPIVCYEAAQVAIDSGFKVVVVGRNYKHKGVGYSGHRSECTLANGPRLMNLTDKLTVPGTALALQGAAAVFCAHSAMCLVSWFMKQPTFVLYPPSSQHDFDVTGGYSFGKDYSGNVSIPFSEYRAEVVQSFLNQVRQGATRSVPNS